MAGASMRVTIGLIVCASAVSTAVTVVGITVGVGGAIAVFECRESHGYGCSGSYQFADLLGLGAAVVLVFLTRFSTAVLS